MNLVGFNPNPSAASKGLDAFLESGTKTNTTT
jgi:hypothetical protein